MSKDANLVGITVNVDMTSPESVDLLNGFLNGLADVRKGISSDDTSTEVKEDKNVKKTPPKKEKDSPSETTSDESEESAKDRKNRLAREKRALEKAKKEREAAEEAASAAEGEEEAAEEETISIESLRRLLSTRIKNNRDAIRGKLKKLDSKNLTSLDPVHFSTFKEFLEDLD